MKTRSGLASLLVAVLAILPSRDALYAETRGEIVCNYGNPDPSSDQEISIDELLHLFNLVQPKVGDFNAGGTVHVSDLAALMSIVQPTSDDDATVNINELQSLLDIVQPKVKRSGSDGTVNIRDLMCLLSVVQPKPEESHADGTISIKDLLSLINYGQSGSGAMNVNQLQHLLNQGNIYNVGGYVIINNITTFCNNYQMRRHNTYSGTINVSHMRKLCRKFQLKVDDSHGGTVNIHQFLNLVKIFKKKVTHSKEGRININILIKYLENVQGGNVVVVPPPTTTTTTTAPTSSTTRRPRPRPTPKRKPPRSCIYNTWLGWLIDEKRRLLDCCYEKLFGTCAGAGAGGSCACSFG